MKYDISLHFDFTKEVNGKTFFDEEKAKHNFEIMNKCNIEWFNTYFNQEVFPNSFIEEKKFAEYVSNLMKLHNKKMSSFHFVGSVLDHRDISQEKVRRYMDLSLETFGLLKPVSFVVHPGTYDEGGFKMNKIAHQEALDKWGKEKTHALIVENLRYFGQQAAKKNIKIAIENLFEGRFYSKIDELIGLVKDINLDNVGYCLDTGHGNVDQIPFEKTIEKMSTQLFELHLHDNLQTKDQHLPIGFGTIPWLIIIDSLNKHTKNCKATFEFFQWPYMDDISGRIAAIQHWRTLEDIVNQSYKTTDWK